MSSEWINLWKGGIVLPNFSQFDDACMEMAPTWGIFPIFSQKLMRLNLLAQMSLPYLFYVKVTQFFLIEGSQPPVDFSEWLAVQKFQIILAMAGPTKGSGEGWVNYERNWPLGRAEINSCGHFASGLTGLGKQYFAYLSFFQLRRTVTK